MWFRRLEARKGKQWYLMWKEDCLETICADMEEYDEFYISPVAFSEELENCTSIERVRSIKIRTRGFWLAWPFGGDFKGVKRLLRAYHFDLDHIFYVRGKRCSWLYLDKSLKGIGYCEFDNWMDYNFNTRSMLRVAGFENCRHEKFFWDMKEDVFDSGIRGGEFKHCEMQGVKNLYVNDEEIFSTCPYWIYAAQNKMNISEEQLLGILLSFRRLKDGIDFFDSRQKKKMLFDRSKKMG